MVAATALLWGAAAWRVVLTLIRGWRGWRGPITVAMICLATMVTGIVWRGPVDGFLGVPNLAGLIARIAIIVAILTGQRTLVHGGPRMQTFAGWEGAAAIMLMAASWAAAPLHGQEVLDLRPLSVTSLPVAIYTVGMDIHLGVAGVLLAVGLVRQARRSRSTGDHVAAWTLATGAVGCGMGAWAAGLLLLQVGVRIWKVPEPALLSTPWVNAFIGLTGATLASALLIFPIGEWVVAQRRVALITPEWRRATASRPEIRLPQGLWARVWRPQLVLHRRRLEVEEARSL